MYHYNNESVVRMTQKGATISLFIQRRIGLDGDDTLLSAGLEHGTLEQLQREH